MKEYIFKGFCRGETMTVAELRQKLAEYPDDMPVLATWEGVEAFIAPDNFEVRVAKTYCANPVPTLVIDVEGY